MTHEQQDSLDRLATIHGRTCVREGYTDRRVRVTVPGGGHFHILESGIIKSQPNDNSVDWTQ